MNLSTSYMGFELAHPLVPGASPMVDDLDLVRRLEDAGAPMIVMHSLFEEQIVAEEVAVTRAIEMGEESYAEALSYLPKPEHFELGPAEYLEQVKKVKDAVSVPVIGSINGVTEGGWLEYARLIQEAGADGLELNLFQIQSELRESGAAIERRQLSIVRAVKDSVQIPIAVKLSPFYSSVAHFANQLDQIGIEALVLFNRFYEPDIDVEHLEVIPVNLLSTPSELLLRLRWIGILSGRIKASLATTGGVHSATEAVKAIMVGAQAVQMVSALLKRGPQHLKNVRDELAEWLDGHGYESLRQMQGSMSQSRCSNGKAFERGNYVRILQSWQSD
jgi:dihydroorotate dehydrogenase (fumarate)